MSISDWGVILATLCGPIVAVQVQKWIDRYSEKHRQRLSVFRQLMATRAARLSTEHVQALNMIDVAFYKDKAVREAWKALFDSLCRRAQNATEDTIINSERDGLLIELLHEMAISLGYDFDRTHLKNQAYSPIAHSAIETEANSIRSELAKMLKEDGALRLKVVGLPPVDDTQRKLCEGVANLYSIGHPLPIRIVTDDPAN